MISVTFWSGGGKKPNSTAHPGGTATTLNCQITEACSILTPTIQISGMYPGFSYAYIPSFNRYYYVTDCVVSKTQTVISLRVDVLHTYKAAIGGTTAYIARSASAYNGFIPDSVYPMQAGTDTLAVGATSPWTGNNFLVQISGANGCRMYQLTTTEFDAFCSALWNAWGNIDGIDDLYASALNPFQYVMGIQKCFVPVGGFGGTSATIYCGNINTEVSGLDVTDGTAYYTRNLTAPWHPNSTGATGKPFLRGTPYSAYSLYVPGAGWVALNANDLVNDNAVELQFFAEPNSGNMRCDVINSGACIASIAGKVCVNWGIGASSVNTIGMVQSGIDFAQAGVNLGFALAGDIYSAHNAVNSVFGMARAGVNGAAAAIPTCQTSGGLSGCVGMTDHCEILLKYNLITDDNLVDYGAPLMERRAIGSLSGFVLCAESDFGSAPIVAENEEVNSFLTGGFYYE